MNLSTRTLAVALSLAAASFSFSSGALAADSCKADADCGPGFFCEISAPPSVGCASKDGTPCTDPTPAPAPTDGYCREKPLSCQADADCPAYLACVSPAPDAISCTAPACPPGANCPEPAPCEQPTPDPNAPKLCAPKVIECKADSECPTGFACNAEIGGACPDIACAPGSDCPAPECSPSKKICAPKELDCKADADCPADWRCITFEEGSCSGGTGTGTSTPPAPGSGGGTDPAPPTPPSPGSKPLDTPPDCTTTVRNLCAPKGYLAGIEQGGAAPLTDAKGSAVAEAATDASNGAGKGSGSGSGSNSPQAPSYSSPTKGSNTQPAAAAASGSDSDSGCSTSGRGQGSGLLSVLLVGLVARLARRRQSLTWRRRRG